MAAAAGSRRDWFLVAEHESDPACTDLDFTSALEVWVSRPQVVNKRLLAAVLHENPLEWSEEERLVAADSDLFCGSVVSNGEGKKRLLVRELLPKSTRVSSGRELVVIGEGMYYSIR